MKPEYSNNTCILSKQVSDYIGRLNGTGYFNALINAARIYLDLPYGSAYSIEHSRSTDHPLIAGSTHLLPDLDLLSILDSASYEQAVNSRNQYVVIDLDKFIDRNNNCLYNDINCLLTFPLVDMDENLTGIIVFATTVELIDQSSIIDTIETQIPRAAAELERIKLKNSLESFENNYNNLLGSTHDVIWEADISGHITSINDSCNTLYGHTAQRMIGKCYSNFMDDDSANDFFEYLALLENGESVYNIISDHLTNEYKLIKVCYNIIPKYDDNNNVVGVIGSTRDISASVQAQKTIKNNSELFSSILSRLPVIFFRVDEKGFLVDIRGNGLKRMGVEDMDWVGRPGYGLFIGMDAKIDSALSGNTVFFENKGTYKGTPWWFYTSMFFDSWSGYGAVGFSVDITEQKYVEQKLVELLKNNRKLAQRLVEVQEDERRNLARELHDELGQSITAVKSLATVINACAGDQNSEITDLADSIIDLSARLYEVVNNIMQRLRPDIIDGLDFNETIKNCIVRSQLETVGVNCELNIIGEINHLEEVVKVTVYRIVQECLTNISKHAMASNVSVLIERDTEYHDQNIAGSHDSALIENNPQNTVNSSVITIKISDDGIGMNTSTLINNNKHAKRHGLQGIHERVTAMGGKLIISGEKGKGVSIQAVIGLGHDNSDFSRDINKCVTDIHKMRLIQTASTKTSAH